MLLQCLILEHDVGGVGELVLIFVILALLLTPLHPLPLVHAVNHPFLGIRPQIRIIPRVRPKMGLVVGCE